MIGINMANARIPDNKGNQPRWQKLIEGAEDGLFSALPVQLMVSRMKAANLPAEVSLSAGTFVCNEVMYRLLQKTKDSSIKAGFIHVPYMKGMTEDKPAMELTDITHALQICVETVVKENNKTPTSVDNNIVCSKNNCARGTAQFVYDNTEIVLS